VLEQVNDGGSKKGGKNKRGHDLKIIITAVIE
jgi:hypothetical protein